jgi:hypothetical protein
MSDIELKEWKPNDRELRLFEQEKMELYKGTFVVCIVYGLSAFILLVVILFTEWGKEFIYDKFAPAVITYILGSLIIIIYLLNAIFSIKPRKVGTDFDSDSSLMCPDFWKLEKVSETNKAAIISNNVPTDASKGTFIPSIVKPKNANIQYRCVYDPKVYGTTKDLLKMKNALDPSTSSTPQYMAGFKLKGDATTHKDRAEKSTLTPDYIVKKATGSGSTTYQNLKNYAQFTGAYGSATYNKIDDATDTETLKIAAANYLVGATGGQPTNAADAKTNYVSDVPLICNVVYPQVLGVLDKDTKEKNEVSCDYAKQCGVSWSSLKCK